jgi:hypothetical protein
MTKTFLLYSIYHLSLTLLYTTTLEHATVVAASFHSDNLYHTSDLSLFLHEKYRSRVNTLKSTSGSSRGAKTSGVNPLEVLHVRLGHASKDLVKWIVKSGVCTGLGYTYDQIKHLQSPLCDACMKGRMKAFPIPPSMTTSVRYLRVPHARHHSLHSEKLPRVQVLRFIRRQMFY